MTTITIRLTYIVSQFTSSMYLEIEDKRAKGIGSRHSHFAPSPPIILPKTGLLEAGLGNVVEKYPNTNQYNILNVNVLPHPDKNYKQSGFE